MSRIAAVPASSSLFNPKKPVYSIEMAFEEFAAFERCPKQRDEKLRTNKAHFDTYDTSMQCVSVGVLPNGKVYKINGHTRVQCVIEGKLLEIARSPMVVTVYSLPNIEAIRAKYDTYDSRSASKTAAETIQSALSDIGLDLVTKRFAAGQFGSALSLAVKSLQQADSSIPRKLNRLDQIRLFETAIVSLDKMDTNPARFNQGTLAAAFLAFRKHGTAAEDFFSAYNTTSGLERGSERNAVRMLHEIRNKMKQDGRVAGGAVNDDQMANTLACFNRHLSSPSGFWERLPAPVRPVDFLRT